MVVLVAAQFFGVWYFWLYPNNHPFYPPLSSHPIFLFLVLQFNLQSLGYTDSGPLSFDNMVAKTWITYKKERLVGLLWLNIMVINYQTEAVVAKRHFCTHCTNTISFLAHSFLKQLGPNMIVLGVVHSDWTKKASPALKALLVSEQMWDLISLPWFWQNETF